MKEINLSERDRHMIRAAGRMQPSKSIEDMRLWIKIGARLNLSKVNEVLQACNEAVKSYRLEDAEHNIVAKVFKSSVENPPQGTGWTFDGAQSVITTLDRLEAAKDLDGEEASGSESNSDEPDAKSRKKGSPKK